MASTTEWMFSSTEIGPTPAPTVWTLSGMTAEEIAFREKCFIGTHWIISIFILAVIPVVYLMNKYERKKQEIRNLEKTIEQQQKEKDISNPTDLPSSPSSDIEPSAPSAGSVNSVKSNSKSRTMSRSHSKTEQEAQGEKVNKMFKICAAICVFLWWSRAVTAACSLMIWHYDYLIAIDIAFPWDTSRMMMYHTSKLIMYLTYMSRIYYAFNKSAYGYPQWFIIGMYVLICSDFIMKLAVYIMMNEISSGAVQDKEEASDFLVGAFVFLVIEECMVTVSILLAFLKPLFVMSKTGLSKKVLEIIAKYSILGLLSILSSVALSLFRLTYVGSFDLMVIWMTAIWVSTDCLINTWCTVLLFGFAQPTYQLLCGVCDRQLRGFVVHQYEKRKQGATDGDGATIEM